MLDPTPQEIDDMSSAEWIDADDPHGLPQDVRHAFTELAAPIEVRSLSGGLLHQSFHLRRGDVEYVLQHVSDVFASEIHENIRAVTMHLAARGLPCAPLIPTRGGELSAQLGKIGRWRLMPHLGGASFEVLQSTAQARSAGELVGRFHAALRDFDQPLAAIGIPYRDTPHYLTAMKQALDMHAGHRLAADMRALGQRIDRTFEQWGPAPDLPRRVIHGDLKIANLLFEGTTPPERDVAFALIDLDTLMRAPLWIELGDAWRSWCNPSRRSSTETRFEMDVFEASLAGFLQGHGDPLARSELDSLAMAPERITLELCARFVTDALEESYFGWDDKRFAHRGEHNAERAHGQWKLYEAMRETRSEREATVRRLSS